jgi:hypothetical protein
MQQCRCCTVHHEYVLLNVMWGNEIIRVYIKFCTYNSGHMGSDVNNKAEAE